MMIFLGSGRFSSKPRAAHIAWSVGVPSNWEILKFSLFGFWPKSQTMLTSGSSGGPFPLVENSSVQHWTPGRECRQVLRAKAALLARRYLSLLTMLPLESRQIVTALFGAISSTFLLNILGSPVAILTSRLIASFLPDEP